MSWVIAKCAETVWAIVGGMAEVVAKGTVVLSTTVLRVARGTLATVGALILWAVDMKIVTRSA